MQRDEARVLFMAAAIEGLLSHTGWHPEFILPESYKQDAGLTAAQAVSGAARKYAEAALNELEKAGP